MDKLTKAFAKMKKYSVPTSQNCTFAKLTTLGCGGTIYLTVYPNSIAQLVFVVRYLSRHKVPYVLLGHGSNVLASDKEFLGVAVVTTQVNGFSVSGQTVVADCGTSTSKLCSALLEHGLSGGEFLGCLPATVGGAVVCNAGCFGQNAQQTVQSVTVLHNGKIKRFSNKQCKFGYRTSIFKNDPRFTVLQVAMQFAQSTSQEVRQRLFCMRQKKSDTQPLGYRSAGCVLCNDKISLSRLIDKAGLKGYKIGGAQVSEKHAGFIINLDKATAQDIYLLIEYVKKILAEKYGVTAKTELCLINFDAPPQ